MRKFEDMEIIVAKESYKEARELVKQLKENPQSTCCIVIAGYRAKSKCLYDELYRELVLFRNYWMFKKNDYPWLVGWKHGCGHMWKDNT